MTYKHCVNWRQCWRNFRRHQRSTRTYAVPTYSDCGEASSRGVRFIPKTEWKPIGPDSAGTATGTPTLATGWDHLIASGMGPPWRVIEDAVGVVWVKLGPGRLRCR